MNYTEEGQDNERLRNLRQQLINLLGKMPQDDPTAPKLLENLKGLNRLLRQEIFNSAMDPCADPDCVEPGTITVGGKRWCAYHGSASMSA
jgi:hypothetical protein